MKFLANVSFVLLSYLAVAGQPAAPNAVQLSPGAREMIQRHADVYGLDPAEAAKLYETMLSRDRLRAVASLDFLDARKAYELVALALPTLEPSVKPTAINLLLKKETFSAPVFNAIIAELDRLNSEATLTDEQRAGQTVMRRRICNAIAKWLELPESHVDPRSPESVAAFSAQAKRRAVTRRDSSPF